MKETARLNKRSDSGRLALPPALKPGDVIGVAAPAGPFEKDRFEKGINRLSDLGFSVHIPEGVFDRNGYLAGSDESRTEILNRLIRDEMVNAVIAARGGYGCMRILEHIDYGALARNPKIVMGFSDITALLTSIYSKSKCVSFHGPVATSLADADDETLSQTIDLLTGRFTGSINLDGGSVLSPGVAEGPLLGGNLTLLVHLLGTPWAPDFDGAVLFFEDVHEAPYRLDRMLTALRLAGVLDKAAGVAVGGFEGCGDDDEIRDVLERCLNGFHGPAVTGLPIGHGERNLALPMGVNVRLDAENGGLTFLEPWTS